jgi:hypothetical protein
MFRWPRYAWIVRVSVPLFASVNPQAWRRACGDTQVSPEAAPARSITLRTLSVVMLAPRSVLKIFGKADLPALLTANTAPMTDQ